MAYRGDDEPEYIDDDDYIDPDALGSGAGSRPSDAIRSDSSNVLGASGSRKDAMDAPQPSGSSAARESMRAQSRSPKKTRRGGAKAAKARASDGKRDARRRAQGSQDGSKGSDPAGRDNQTGRSKGRFSGLRPRYRRNKPTDDSRQNARDGDNNGKTSKLQALRGRFGNLRHSLKRPNPVEDARLEQPVRRAEGKSSKPSIRAAFGAGSGDTRRTGRESGSAGRAQARMDRADDDERHASPGSHIRPSKAPVFKSSEWLDLDRKLDLIGVGLVFGAIVLFFSAMSSEQAAIGAVHRLIGQLLGWGAAAVPITMFAIGMWLIVRHFGDQAPLIDPVRLAGTLTAFTGALVLFQFGESLGYAGDVYCAPDCVRGLVERSYLGGRGGGLIGGWIYQVLVINLTEAGGFVIVAMVLTFATMMITRLSMAELAAVTIGFTRSLRDNMAQRAARRRARQLQMEEQMMLARQEATVRVSKPETGKLSGSVAGMNALPEPSGAAMPIPLRLRDMFSKRVSLLKASAETGAAAAARGLQTAKAPNRPGQRVFGRFFSPGAGSASDTRNHTSPGDTSAVTASRPKVRPNWRSYGAEPAPTMEPAEPTGRPAEGQSEGPDIAPAKPQEPPLLSDDKGHQTARARDKTRKGPRPWEPPKPKSDSAQVIRPTSEADEPLDSFRNTEVPSKQIDDEPDAVAESPAVPPGRSRPIPRAAQPADRENQTVPTEPARRSRPRGKWQLLDKDEYLTGGSTGEMDEEVLLRQAGTIEETLASFGAPGRVVELNTGPVITQFGVEPDYLTSRAGKRSRVKVSAIAQLDKDLQLALGAKSIRVEAPVPGKGYVGIEVPNPDSAMVSLRDVMESRGFQHIDSPLAIALGMSVDGKPVSADLTQMPHLLIAGTTGSGKSKCINAIIISILANRSPDEVKFIMVDPKRVELTGYNGLPHLVAPVVVELEKTVGVLRWVTREMDERYKKFSKAGARNLVDYNHILDAGTATMPYIVVIIDELADLMMSAPEETERAISRIAALARATGIHLVIATQRPSVDVVTGLIKANFPARIAFAVAGSVDSRVILDQPGAERLLGKGDMLYLSGDAPAPMRMQGVFVSDEEINGISRFWKLQNLGIAEIEAISLPPEAGRANKRPNNGQGFSAADVAAPNQASFWDSSAQSDAMGVAADDSHPQEDELYQTAVDMVRRLEKASISLLQRRLRIGYTRAARLVDMMEERGVVGPPKEGSSKPRDVLPE